MSDPLFQPRYLSPEVELQLVRARIAEAEAGMRDAELQLRLKQANRDESRAQLDALYRLEAEVVKMQQARQEGPGDA